MAKKPNPLPLTPDLTDAEDAVTNLEATITEPFDPPRRDHLTPALANPNPDSNSDFQQPWDQLPDESSNAYSHFITYRDLGRKRTQMEVARVCSTKQPTISKQAKLYNWSHRIQAWDNEEERLYRLNREIALREMADRHVSEIQTAIEAISVPFQAIKHRLETDPDLIDTLAAGDVQSLLKTATAVARTFPSLLQAERLAQGVPTEIIAGNVDHTLTVEISDDSLNEVVATLVAANALPGSAGSSEAGEIVDAEMVEFHPVPGGERPDQP